MKFEITNKILLSKVKIYEDYLSTNAFFFEWCSTLQQIQILTKTKSEFVVNMHSNDAHLLIQIEIPSSIPIINDYAFTIAHH